MKKATGLITLSKSPPKIAPIQNNNLLNSPQRDFSELKYLPKNYLNNYNAI